MPRSQKFPVVPGGTGQPGTNLQRYWDESTMSIRFSVIVPVFNASAFLPRVIEALLEQEYPASNFEILLVDNESADDSADVIRRYPRVRLLTQTRPGSYAARNLGLAEASGEILAFTDSDCVVDGRWLQSIEAVFSRAGVQVLLGRTRPGNDSGLISLISDYENQKAEYVCQVGHSRQQYAYTNNMAVRAETWRRYGPFVELMRGADVSFVRRIVDGEPRGAISYCPEMVVRHLELTGVAAYYRKMYIYGRSLQSYRKVVPAEPLTLDDRIRVLLRTANRRGYSMAKALALTAGLAGGLAAWFAGGLAGGSWRRKSTETPEETDSPQVAEPPRNARVSVVLEWENAVLAVEERGSRMLDALISQVQGLAGGMLADPVELLVVYRSDHVKGRHLGGLLERALEGRGELFRLRLIPFLEGEYYDLKNQAAREASGDILVFLDSDTIPEERWLESLLRPMGDESLQCVCGCSSIEADGVMGRAFSVMWFFPPRQDSNRLEPVKLIFANNFAVRRAVFERIPFRPVPGTCRGACVLWREELLEQGIPIMQSYGARVGHPPPNGLRHFIVRALTHGRDLILQARHKGKVFERGAFGTAGRTALNLTRSTVNVFARRRAVGVSWLEAPVTLAIAYSYYGIFFLGEILTYLAPKWMIRTFRI